ncbi:hypothetical protein GCM10007385_35350 [Tateyamaria omphalii]|uniref:helix-turn-helix domain-containing protein n=1 Tax=Tateyamaria omphalii TaxID=299262 RepID=UPI001678866E|nr:helix-turn-helix domain-containing protein [Tateyamaria omphalii]GGX63150.1 hypothetical protein GCM10007385_35350 [Tateyamaria omphalii]
MNRLSIPTAAREVINETAALARVSVEDLLSHKRDRRLAWPRQEAMTALHRSGRFSFPQIGVFFDRDHSTVQHAKSRVLEREAEDEQVAERVYHLTVIAEQKCRKPKFFRHGAVGFKSMRGHG